MKSSLILLLALLTSSCAQSILINYSYDQTQPSGTLVVIPDQPISGVNFVLNDRLLIEKKNIKKITIENVPTGECKFAMTCSNWYYKYPLNYRDSVRIEANKEVTKLVPTPPLSTGYYIYLVGSGIVPVILLLLVL